MAELDGVETIFFREQTPTDRAAEHIKRMRRDGEQGLAASGPKSTHILKGLQTGGFLAAYIKKDNVRPFDPHLSGGNQQNSHGRRVSENFRTIEDRIMQGDCQDAEPELARPLEKLMGRVIDDVLGVIQRVDVQIHFDPVVLFFLVHFHFHPALLACRSEVFGVSERSCSIPPCRCSYS